jgi:DNA-binding NtrC family response regulator
MTILLVDDDAAFRGGLAEAVEDLGYPVSQAGSVHQALQLLESIRPALAIVDLRMPGEDGLVFLQKARLLAPEMPCVILTAYASGQNTIEAMRMGAFDHLTKPVGRDELKALLARTLPLQGLAKTPRVDAELAQQEAFIGNSEAMRQVFKLIGQASRSDATVMILGETGTGKEMVARALHQNGPRKDGPFVAVNCGAIPADLLESELFGHVKGAYTGAHASRLGRFREAIGGTLFLDEIGDMNLATQAKILRVLQERQVSPVGGESAVNVDVRVVAATHRDLPAWVAQGLFREDLWYRLQVISIVLPPLRERLSDVVPLAEHFLRLAADGQVPLQLGDDVKACLLNHAWPGNVRELRNAMQRAAALSSGMVIDAQVLNLAVPAGGDVQPQVNWQGGLDEAVASVELAMIRQALERADNNRTQAARLLGISRQHLYRKLEEFGLRS